MKEKRLPILETFLVDYKIGRKNEYLSLTLCPALLLLFISTVAHHEFW